MKKTLFSSKNFVQCTLAGLLLTPLATQAALPLTAPERVDIAFTKETINGLTFTYRSDIVNGTIKQSWNINGQPVDEKTYEDKHEEARFQYLKKLRAQERAEQKNREARQQQHQRFTLDMRLEGARKILSTTVETVEKKLSSFAHLGLHDYYAYQPNSFASEQALSHLTHTVVPQAYTLMRTTPATDEETAAHDALITDMDAMTHLLDEHYDKLLTFFQDTVRRAITLMNDTSRLKELLAALE